MPAGRLRHRGRVRGADRPRCQRARDSRWRTRFTPRRFPASATSCRRIARWPSSSTRFEPTIRRLVGCLEREADRPGGAQVEARAPISVPVCYGGELGPDLADVAAFAGMSPDEVVVAHTRAHSTVCSCSASCRDLPTWACWTSGSRCRGARRRACAFPAGRSALRAPQTGIYPAETPGGWQLIGRTPVKPFDAARPAAVSVQGRATPSVLFRSGAPSTSAWFEG